MSEPMRLGLDNPGLNGRWRAERVGLFNVREYLKDHSSPRYLSKHTKKKPAEKVRAESLAPIWARPLSKTQTVPAKSVKSAPAPPVAAPAATPAPSPPAQDPRTVHALANTAVTAWMRPVAAVPPGIVFLRYLSRKIDEAQYTRLQLALVGMAAFVFLLGVGASLQAVLTNHGNTAKVSALSKEADAQAAGGGSQDGSAPSTTKPSGSAVRSYVVAPDLPRYIKIPKLGINARVMQAGVTAKGALAAPSNVYDAAWYTGSAKPGQPGAMLIDGHVSSWTTHGVFYNLKKLAAGDTIQIQRGDGAVLTYKVIKTQTYADDKVDMQAAITPVTAGKSGLNLITCTGQVKPGTSEFNQRLVVFTEQI